MFLLSYKLRSWQIPKSSFALIKFPLAFFVAPSLFRSRVDRGRRQIRTPREMRQFRAHRHGVTTLELQSQFCKCLHLCVLM